MPKTFEDGDTQYAYECIQNFFDVFGLDTALQYADNILLAAIRPAVWNKEVPANLLFYTEKTTALCNAAFTIHFSNTQRSEAIIVDPQNDAPDISITKNFSGENYVTCAWNSFPRHLTGRQYHNPYRAIKKFCRYMADQEWNKFLKKLTEYALSKDQLDDLYPSYHLLKILRRLQQLLEACHLLHVRTHI